jgi:hypothetical protein
LFITLSYCWIYSVIEGSVFAYNSGYKILCFEELRQLLE